MTAFSITSDGQDTASKLLSKTEYVQLIKDVREGTDSMRAAKMYREEIDSLLKEVAKKDKEIDRKEAVIVAQLALKYECLKRETNLTAQMFQKDFHLRQCETAMNKLAKPDKRFALSIGGGYGFGLNKSVVTMQPIAGILLVYNIFKF